MKKARFTEEQMPFALQQVEEGIVESFSGFKKRNIQDQGSQAKKLHAKIGEIVSAGGGFLGLLHSSRRIVTEKFRARAETP